MLFYLFFSFTLVSLLLSSGRLRPTTASFDSQSTPAPARYDMVSMPVFNASKMLLNGPRFRKYSKTLFLNVASLLACLFGMLN
jgi:hypothetical protein